ncbi:MAG TPA: serine/threonine-protein kinase [Thermoanaerobaculia bacterium]|jgi:tetratricopeptide (TPR) repeat protein
MSSNESLGPYQIGERVGNSVWIAEDTRNGKRVALKLLTKQLPKDPAKRDALIREVRLNAALGHAFVVPIQEIAAVGDFLVMIMDIVEVRPLSKYLDGQPRERGAFFDLAYQLTEALKYLHTRGMLHGNINGDSVMVMPNGQVKLGGFNAANLVGRRDGGPTAYQQKGNDARSVAYMAPEVIANQAIDAKADVFSAGVVMYEIATGRLPFAGTTAADIARAIVEGNPASPKAVNPAIDNAVLAVLGGCLFKDQYRRHKDSRALAELIAKAAPESVEKATELAKKVTVAPSASAQSDSRKAILFIADIANFDALDRAADPDAAPAASARVQQMFGESVFLFNGSIVDPFGMPIVGEMPSVEEALEAARKAEFDFSPDQQTGEVLQVRMLLHYGEVTTEDGVVAGPAMERAREVLDQLPALRLHLTEDFVKMAKGVRTRDGGAKAGVKLYQIHEPEPEPEATELETSLAEAAEAAAFAAELAEKKKRKKRMALMSTAAGAIVAIGGALGVMWMRQSSAPAAVAAPVARVQAPPSATNPRKVLIQPFAVEGADPVLPERANAIRLAAVEVLRSFPELRIAEAAAEDVDVFTAKLRLGAAGPELVPVGKTPAAAIAATDVASGVDAFVKYVAANVRMQPRAIATADALNAFTLALTATDDAQVEQSLRAATLADPTFLAAQMHAMKFFEKHSKPLDALAAARQVVVLDPLNMHATRKVARASLGAGELQQAFALYGSILGQQRNDEEALNVMARYTLATADTQRFGQVLTRMRAVPVTKTVAHEPDILIVNGRIEQAIDRYYDIEVKVPNNPALSFKIGRLSILRHAVTIADLELEKLKTSDPLYGYPMLKAYIAAEKRQRGEAEAALKQAMAAAQPGDDAWTCAAEVYAILADNNSTINALEKAAARKEPTAAYVLANPLFEYLSSDARFQKLRDTLTAQKQEIRTALAQVAL